MIINSLYRHYQNLAQQPDLNIPLPGFSVAKVSFAFVLSEEGELLNVIPLIEQQGARTIPLEMQVPEQIKRSSGIAANFLCDNSSYIIGVDNKGKPERSKQAFEACKELHTLFLTNVDDPGARAVSNYFSKWVTEEATEHPALGEIMEDLLAGGNIVFRLDGQKGYVHERNRVKSAWLHHYNQNTSQENGQCLVTGEVGPIARLHPSIKGVRGAQSSGASLVSFNFRSSESYGKIQGNNAPVSEDVAFGYTTVLNYMLSSRRQRLQLDPNTTVVFWSERKDGGMEEDLMAELLWPSGNTSKSDENPVDLQTVQLVHDILIRVRSGQPVDLDPAQIDLNSRFAILGLSPNAARLSIRFWWEDSFGNILTRLAMHYVDMSIVGPTQEGRPELISVPRVLLETAPRLGGERPDPDRISPLLGGAVLRSVLGGKPYPQGLYTAIISRVRSDQIVNYVRAAIIKACLLRKYRFQGQQAKEVSITMELNEKNNSTAYNLGRLFAALEKAQQDATPGLNATIRDRYFGAASATPKSVFPILLRLAQHHISKAEYGYVSDKRIEEIMAKIEVFPAHLNLDEQGEFMLGYYHQRQAFFQKTSGKEV